MSRKDIPSKKIMTLDSIVNLIAKGSTPGERNAARHAATKMLNKYGWTLTEFLLEYYPDRVAKSTAILPPKRKVRYPLSDISLSSWIGIRTFMSDVKVLLVISKSLIDDSWTATKSQPALIIQQVVIFITITFITSTCLGY